MQVILQNDVAIDFKLGLSLQKPPGIQHYFYRFSASEQRLPMIDRRRQEMWTGLVENTVTASGHFKLFIKSGSWSFRLQFPSWSLGTRCLGTRRLVTRCLGAMASAPAQGSTRITSYAFAG